MLCKMCDIPHVINILESEYVLFADPLKYNNDVHTIYNIQKRLKMLFCFFFPDMPLCFFVLQLVSRANNFDGTCLPMYIVHVHCTCQEKLLELVMEIKSRSMDLSPNF